MKHLLTVLILFLSLQLFAKNNLTYIKIERTPCYGKCPTYSVELKPDGKLIYNGKANVKMLGIFDGQISKEQAAKIFKEYENQILDNKLSGANANWKFQSINHLKSYIDDAKQNPSL